MTRDIAPSGRRENLGHIVLLISAVFQHEPALAGEQGDAFDGQQPYIAQTIGTDASADSGSWRSFCRASSSSLT